MIAVIRKIRNVGSVNALRCKMLENSRMEVTTPPVARMQIAVRRVVNGKQLLKTAVSEKKINSRYCTS